MNQRPPRALKRRLHSPRLSSRLKERGSIAVEFAYSMPIILIIFVVMMMLSDIHLTKHQLSVSLHQSARACGMYPNENQVMECVRVTMLNSLGENVSGKCDVSNGVALLNWEDDRGWFVAEVGCTYQGYQPIRLLASLFEGDVATVDALFDIKVQSVFARYGRNNNN
jgi:hypothetical protein